MEQEWVAYSFDYPVVVYSLKNVLIVTDCIGDNNDANKRNNCLNLICVLNIYLSDEY